MPDNAYIDEHGLPRLACGAIDYDEWWRIETDLRMDRLAGEIRTQRLIEDVFARIRRKERGRWAALSWWHKLWEARPW